ncbi:MAG TPA: hypothetical protein VMP67_10220 [Candidatus Limnocylindria bacterium]|nr:hypothetical protein [Candidatus Limnocylindria bacterium]
MTSLARVSLAGLLLLTACGPSAQVSPSPTAQPSPTQASESPTAGAPTAGPSPTDTEQPASPTPANPTALASPSAAPTAAPDAWQGPALISERGYHEPSLVIDASGVAHVAARLNDGIFYLTNASGSWTRERVSRPPRDSADEQPSIAIDADGTLAVAFTRMYDSELGRFPQEVLVADNRGGTWSSPRQIAAEGANSPSIKLRDGTLHICWVQGGPTDVIDDDAEYPVLYATESGGALDIDEVASNGALPRLELAADGSARILIGSPFWSPIGVIFAVGDGAGSFALERLPATTGDERNVKLALDDSGAAHAIWSSWPENVSQPTIEYATHNGGSWSSPEPVLENALETALAGDSAGGVRAALGGPDGVWYVIRRGGTLASERLSSEEPLALDLVVDDSGRAHLVFISRTGAGTAFWYGVGPAD